MEWTKGRILSLAVSAVYLALAAFVGGALFLRTLAYLVFVLACIWFGDEMGAYTGMLSRGPAITKETPGCLIRAFGWLLLLLPLALILFARDKLTK